MTIIGKILTWFIFLFSLVFFGFAVTINQLNKDPQTAKSWYTLVWEYRNVHYPRWQKDLEARNAEIVDLRSELNNIKAEITKVKEASQKEVEQARDRIGRAEAEANLAKQNFAQSQVAAQQALTESEKRRAEAVGLYEKIKNLDSTIASLKIQMTENVNKRVQEEVKAATYLERLRAMEQQVRELTALVEQKSQSDLEKAQAPGRLASEQPRPPADVQGVITDVAPSGLVQLSIGSDAGLMKGHVLEVFRTSPQPKYLGLVSIIEVKPHSAVGTLLDPKARKLVQADDKVASRILMDK
jgi:hypothetical protein